MTRRPIAALLTLLLTLAALAGTAGTAAAFPPGQGPGGPILVVSDPADPFGRYYAEILTAEGLNAFDVRDVAQVSAATLSGYSVVILAPTAVSPTLASSLSAWVQGGGNLIAMRPDASLAGLLGLGSDTGDLDNRYIRVNTSSAPGVGITGETIQFHDRADLWTLAGATPVADLYSTATAATAQSRRDAAQRRHGRRPGRGVHLRPGPLDRPDAPGQPGLGGRRAGLRARRLDEVERLVLWREAGRRAAGLGESQQGRHPAGGRAAATAGEPRHADECRPHADAALLVLPARRASGRGHDGRRPHERRDRRPLQSVPAAQPAGLLGRGLGVRALDVVRLHEQQHDGRPSRGLPGARLRDRAASQRGLRELHGGLAARVLAEPASRFPRQVGGRGGAAHQPHPLHRLERLGQRGERGERVRDPAGHELLLLARQLGPEPARDVHRVGHSRCDSPTSTAR